MSRYIAKWMKKNQSDFKLGHVQMYVAFIFFFFFPGVFCLCKCLAAQRHGKKPLMFDKYQLYIIFFGVGRGFVYTKEFYGTKANG
jgi:hypothetical protein